MWKFGKIASTFKVERNKKRRNLEFRAELDDSTPAKALWLPCSDEATGEPEMSNKPQEILYKRPKGSQVPSIPPHKE
jgi:hypothetical protein